MTAYTLDATDYAVLQCINDASKPVWKKEIHGRIERRIGEFPELDSVSVQTVGRHVDTLHDQAYLESCIISPDHLNRDLIISYKLTEDGVTALQEKRDTLIKTQIMGDEHADKQELLALLDHEIGFDSEMWRFLEGRGPDEIIGLAEIYYMRKYLDQKVDQDLIEKLKELSADSLDTLPVQE